MSEDAPNVAVVVVNYASTALLELNLAPLAQSARHLDVVVVDCYSSERERERVARLCEIRGWIPVLLGDNRGFGGGVNAGAAVAFNRGASVIVVLNPDASISAPDLSALAYEAVGHPARLVAPVIHRPDGTVWSEGVDLYLDDGSMGGVRRRGERPNRPRMFWASGACFAVSASLWEAIGGFDEDYFLYWEDVDLCRRVYAVGGEVEVTAAAVAIHDEGGTHEDRGRGRAKSETYYYYSIRNRFLFAQKHLGEGDRDAWRRSARRVAHAILLQGGRRQLVSSTAPWRAMVRGLRDGRAGRVGAA